MINASVNKLTEIRIKNMTINRKKILILTTYTAIFLTVIYTYVLALSVYVAPSENFPLEISVLETLDTSNSSSSAFPRGETVRINTTIYQALEYINFPFTYDYYSFTGDTNYKIIIMVMDSQKKPVYLQSLDTSISPGDTDLLLSDYTIGNTSPTGTYSVKVMVWTNWLPNGKALAPNTPTATFSVS